VFRLFTQEAVAERATAGQVRQQVLQVLVETVAVEVPTRLQRLRRVE
jgi:hypothetical protein